MSVQRTGTEILRTMRPHQWVKNLFVLTPLLFGGRLFDGWADLRAGVTFVVFCLLSGAVYLLNDIVDRHRDQAHPVKCHRPIAAGRLAVGVAVRAMVAIVLVVLVTSALVQPWLLPVTAGYFLLNVAYSFGLKHVVFVDIVCIAVGFILRIVAGAVAVAVELSPWLVLCTFLLALFLGLGKRKHELLTAGENAERRRRVLLRYRLPHVNLALNLAAAVLTFVYLLYTTSERTVQVFGTNNLLFTVPFIVFGLLRFLQLVDGHRDDESPTDTMIKDPIFILNLVLWGATVTGVIYAW